MIGTSTFLAGALSLVLQLAPSRDGLGALIFEGPELHASLTTRQLEAQPIRHVPRDLVHEIPQLSSDSDFIQTIARAGSQGRLDGLGVRAALYALYDGDNELGFYGLEMASAWEADRREEALREIWKHNVSVDRAQVHRQGLVLLVVWTDGVSAECWQSVNARISERLKGR